MSNFATYIINKAMVSKTRDRLIEVARQLFVNKGVENTTMNDIAAASDKGRRTIYTYFKSKREIYNAVVEAQSNAVIETLTEIVESDLEPMEKLRKYLVRRFELIERTSQRIRKPYERYRTLFSRDARRVEKIYEMARMKERGVFARLVQEGVNQGVFNPVQAERLLNVMTLVFIAWDHFNMNMFSDGEYDPGKMSESVIEFVTEGIK